MDFEEIPEVSDEPIVLMPPVPQETYNPPSVPEVIYQMPEPEIAPPQSFLPEPEPDDALRYLIKLFKNKFSRQLF
jgi:hypothetical protein